MTHIPLYLCISHFKRNGGCSRLMIHLTHWDRTLLLPVFTRMKLTNPSPWERRGDLYESYYNSTSEWSEIASVDACRVAADSLSCNISQYG